MTGEFCPCSTDLLDRNKKHVFVVQASGLDRISSQSLWTSLGSRELRSVSLRSLGFFVVLRFLLRYLFPNKNRSEKMEMDVELGGNSNRNTNNNQNRNQVILLQDYESNHRWSTYEQSTFEAKIRCDLTVLNPSWGIHPPSPAYFITFLWIFENGVWISFVFSWSSL